MKQMTDTEVNYSSDFINEVDNLEDTSDLPTSLIITSLDARIYSEPELKNEFESLFRKFQKDATFQYFKSFKRARVNFVDGRLAAKARIRCHQRLVGDSMINCYFSQPLERNSDGCLKPPSPHKQFLISPPASPPVGWEPVLEHEPLINYELLAALSRLTPGEAHELHPPSELHPGIVVHVCEDAIGEDGKPLKSKIQQTRRPDSRSADSGGNSP